MALGTAKLLPAYTDPIALQNKEVKNEFLFKKEYIQHICICI